MVPLFHIIVPHDALYQNCTNGSTPLNKGAARALDKKDMSFNDISFWTTGSNSNIFIEMFHHDGFYDARRDQKYARNCLHADFLHVLLASSAIPQNIFF